METNLQKIQKMIVDSVLSKDEQNDFIALLALASDADLDPMAQLFSEDRGWVLGIYQNIKVKRVALTAGDPASWRKILQEEDTQLKELER